MSACRSAGCMLWPPNVELGRGAHHCARYSLDLHPGSVLAAAEHGLTV
ncbi:hypothetical protein JOH49_009575 [Bradyrhizobium elkanii]|uniref:Uncharacterized protein n=1 Tax=Bradyrhizobium elkanii TaxID=29448 RepID=A0A8I1YHK1_BRAEL|nr:hypothetical protein [Bradyrhizobium elkanii]